MRQPVRRLSIDSDWFRQNDSFKRDYVNCVASYAFHQQQQKTNSKMKVYYFIDRNETIIGFEYVECSNAASNIDTKANAKMQCIRHKKLHSIRLFFY